MKYCDPISAKSGGWTQWQGRAKEVYDEKCVDVKGKRTFV